MTHPGPMPIHRATVKREWLDYNGHMNDANYLMVCGFALDLFMEHVGLGEAARKEHGMSLYTLQAHLSYMRELREGDAIRVETRVLDFDDKRVVLYYEIFREKDAADAGPVAACETMNLHVDMRGPKSAQFLTPTMSRIDALAQDAKRLPPAKYAGRPIAIPRRTSSAV